MNIDVQLTSRIPEYIKALELAVQQEVIKQSNELLVEAKIQCPYKTGRLRASGSAIPENLGSITSINIQFDVKYAMRVEMRKHFFYRSYTKKEQDIIDRIAGAIKRI